MTPDDLHDALRERGLHRNYSRAARVLQIDRTTLWRKLRGLSVITDTDAIVYQHRLNEHDRQSSRIA